MRGKILDAAVSLFQARGYHDTSMQDVRIAAGVTNGALHHHFPSKKALGLAVVNDRVAEMLRTAWIDPIGSEANIADGVSASMSAIATGLDAQGCVRGCPVNNLAVELAFSDPDFRLALQSLFEDWHKAIVTKLGSQPVRRMAGAGPDAIATLIIAAYSGAMNMAKAEQSSRAIEATRELLVTLLRSGEDEKATGRQRAAA